MLIMASDDDTADNQPLIVQLVPGHPGIGEFTLRVTPAYEAEITELLQENDLYSGAALEHSVTDTVLAIIIVAVSSGGALTKLADVLKAFFERHKDKEITLRSHTYEVTVKGFSRHQTERLIQTTAELQAKWDQQSVEHRIQQAAHDERRLEQTKRPDDS